jgi:O-acetyl-ADP-ribose deacetylase (regulator of RNase III)
MLRYKTGDLFESGLPALAHGVNCRGVMGAGIAVQFADRYPLMYKIYRDTCRSGKLHPGDVLPFRDPDTGLWIFNLATQDGTGADATPWAFALSLAEAVRIAAAEGIEAIGMPLIGCGIGGLSRAWLDTIVKPYQRAPVDLTVYSLPEPGKRTL